MPPPRTAAWVRRRFRDGGAYFRLPDEGRRSDLGSTWHLTYKKGWEARFPVADEAEAVEVSEWLAELGITAGSPFVKGKRLCVPVYGRAVVERLREIAYPTTAGSSGRRSVS